MHTLYKVEQSYEWVRDIKVGADSGVPRGKGMDLKGALLCTFLSGCQMSRNAAQLQFVCNCYRSHISKDTLFVSYYEYHYVLFLKKIYKPSRC